jgi:hypothetical protein
MPSSCNNTMHREAMQGLHSMLSSSQTPRDSPLDTYEQVPGDSNEDVVLVFDMHMREIEGSQEHFKHQVAAHVAHAIAVEVGAKVDASWVHIKRLEQGSIRASLSFGSGPSCGGTGGGISAEAAVLAVHRQAMAVNSPLKLGPLGIRLQGVEMSTHSLERMGDGADASRMDQRRRSALLLDDNRLVDLDRSSSTAQSTLTRLASYPQGNESVLRTQRESVAENEQLMELLQQGLRAGALKVVSTNTNPTPRLPSQSPSPCDQRNSVGGPADGLADEAGEQLPVTFARLLNVTPRGSSQNTMPNPMQSTQNTMRSSINSTIWSVGEVDSSINWDEPLYHDRMRGISLEDRLGPALETALRRAPFEGAGGEEEGDGGGDDRGSGPTPRYESIPSRAQSTMSSAEASDRFGPISRATSYAYMNSSSPYINMRAPSSPKLNMYASAVSLDTYASAQVRFSRAGSTQSVASDRFGPSTLASNNGSLEVAPAYLSRTSSLGRGGGGERRDLSGLSMAWPQGVAGSSSAVLSQSLGLQELDFQTPPWGRSLSAFGSLSACVCVRVHAPDKRHSGCTYARIPHTSDLSLTHTYIYIHVNNHRHVCIHLYI